MTAEPAISPELRAAHTRRRRRVATLRLMLTHGSLAAQIQIESSQTSSATLPPLPFPADLLLGLGHIVAENEEECPEVIDNEAA